MISAHVSLDYARRLKDAGYDQRSDKTRTFYIRTGGSAGLFPAVYAGKGLWLSGDDFSEDYDVLERYAAPTVEEMLDALKEHKPELWASGDGEWWLDLHRSSAVSFPCLREVLVRGFEQLKVEA